MRESPKRVTDDGVRRSPTDADDWLGAVREGGPAKEFEVQTVLALAPLEAST